MPRQSLLIPGIVQPKSRKYACKIYEHFDDIAFCSYKPRNAAVSATGFRASIPVKQSHEAQAVVPLEYLTRFGE